MSTPDEVLSQQEAMLTNARAQDSTPFDYIIVGSGAAGGPLAARLAENGKTVLVLEAGIDALDDKDVGHQGEFTGEHTEQTYKVPAFHGACTEDKRMSWGFSVRHFENTADQKLDTKYNADKDPEANAGPGKGGIFYPRASGVGGCTTHHAMIVVRPNDSDWNRIADRTGDTSWRAENMQGYFARIEDCLYYDKFEGAFGKVLFVYKWLKRLYTYLAPRSQLSRGGHGRHGWQKTSFIDPALIWRISKGDSTFRSVLLRVIFFLLTREGRLRRFGEFLKTLRIVQLLDPNFGTARSGLNAQLSFIPIGTDGRERKSVRERLLSVAKDHPLRLVIKKQTFVKRVVFKKVPDNAPEAIGVEVTEGYPLYEAAGVSPDGARAPSKYFFAREEVILAGGSFNTPQLLMLSGIGDKDELTRAGVSGIRGTDERKLADIVHLPGVGRNLQDRYEVSVISETDKEFKTLANVAFKPLDDKDPALTLWKSGAPGLYSTNGGALSFFYTTKATADAADTRNPIDPDLFIFGAPAAFRGYYWNWSKELLFKTKGSGEDIRRLWTWVILKAYTSNNQGRVTLRDTNPFRQPEICFNSFPASDGSDRDLAALNEGVEFVRTLNKAVPRFETEVQPAGKLDLDWIRNEAWGHHACGTCRIGSDSWRGDTGNLQDREAVLDPDFRVHGVKNLRVVDASVFPEIPGYFIVTPVFMIAEKAADVLLATRAHQTYPARLEEREAMAVRDRRRVNRDEPLVAAEMAKGKLPEDTVGLALSGGGIRSATLCLGVLQALAQRGRLKSVDMLATVSGGGYIGSFLGRLFTRQPKRGGQPGERVEKIVGDVNSAENRWLREHANYLSGGGRVDKQVNLGVIWRNLLGAHMCLATMYIGVFALLRLLTDNTALGAAGTQLGALTVSPWWWLPVAVFVLGIFPAWLAYWLAQKPGAAKPHPLFGLFTWLVMLGAAIAALRLQKVELIATVAVTSLLVAWLWQEFSRIRAIKPDGREQDRGAIIRNRLSRGLGLMLTVFAFTTAWVVLDSLARLGAQNKLMFPLVGVMGGLATIMPLLRDATARFSKGTKTPSPTASSRMRNFAAGAIAFPLLALLLFGYDVIAHTAFQAGERVGLWTMAITLLIALILSRAHGFLNLTSLNGQYASRLARTFLGASCEARVHANPADAPPDVSTAHPDDDTFYEQYRPEEHGGPLHLISVCVNETVDAMSGRPVAEDKGMTMCVGPAGISVGRRFHALWAKQGANTAMWSQKIMRSMEQTNGKAPAVHPLPVGPDPNSFHVLSRDPMRDRDICVVPEHLRLSQWMAISGAAFTPGQGRQTNLPMALLLGLFNIRLGYWWDSGVEAGGRPGRFPPSFLRRLGAIPSTIFRTQSMLLSEWYRHFKGPGHREWYLSDGGHIENSALYELMRRRVRFMIMVDGTHDPKYVFDDLAALVRRARLDFNARVDWIDPAKEPPPLPDLIHQWIDTKALGSIESLKREGKHAAALACVTYGDDVDNKCWLMVLKGCLVPEELTLDLRCYSTLNEDFPNTPTADQFLDGDQWESYRLLGQQTARRIFRQVEP